MFTTLAKPAKETTFTWLPLDEPLDYLLLSYRHKRTEVYSVMVFLMLSQTLKHRCGQYDYLLQNKHRFRVLAFRIEFFPPQSQRNKLALRENMLILGWSQLILCLEPSFDDWLDLCLG